MNPDIPKNEGTSGAGSSGSSVPSSSGGNLIPNIPNLPNIGGLGALGGGGFDISAALSFISAITGIFSCDILPKCSPNETHTLQEGGSGKPSTDEPSNVGVAKAAQARASAPNRDPLARAGFDPRYDTPGG